MLEKVRGVRLDDERWDKVKDAAWDRRTSIQAVVEQLIDEGLPDPVKLAARQHGTDT